MIDRTALKQELLNDPEALGYGPLLQAGDHEGLAQRLNAPRPGVRAPSGVVQSHAVVNAVDRGDYLILAPADKDWLRFVVSVTQVDLGPGPVRQGLSTLFPEGSSSRANLLRLADRAASRADQFGWDVVDPPTIAEALREE